MYRFRARYLLNSNFDHSMESSMASKPYFENVSINSVANTTGIDRSGNFGGIALGDFSVAIDCGRSIIVGSEFKQQLEKYFQLPVKYLILTHTHSDHRNGIDAFTENEIILSTKCYQNLPRSYRSKKYKFDKFDEKTSIKNDDLVIRLFHVAGHTVGSSIVFFPDEKVLFSGDLLFLGGANYNIPFLNLYQNNPNMTGNPDECIVALEKMLSLEIDTLVPGHGGIVTNVDEELNMQLDLYYSLKSHFIEELGANKTIDEIQLPHVDLIEKAIEKTQGYSSTKRKVETRWLSNYLNKLKTSFFNHYSTLD